MVVTLTTPPLYAATQPSQSSHCTRSNTVYNSMDAAYQVPMMEVAGREAKCS